jgi:hypothetical protein
MSWNIRELREKVRSRLAPSDFTRFDEAVGSFSAKHRIAAYHAIQARTILDKPLAARSEDPVSSLMMAMLGPTRDQVSRDISFAYVETEAHVYAFAHALHAASDILAKVVCYALPSDCRALAATKINLRTVAKALHPKHPNLSKGIEDLLSCEEYKYLAAFTNQIKHHSVIGLTVPFEYDESSGKWLGLQLDEFEYRGVKQPPKYLMSFVTRDHNSVELGYIAIGCELNKSQAG